VQVVASGALFRSGVILNAGDAIERLAEADTVIFDKTGTLTLPEPRVENVEVFAPELLEQAARLALSSRHPLAQALAREARTRTPFPGAVEQPGQGVRALIGGSEARLGSAAFCGEALAPDLKSDVSSIVFTHAGERAVFAIRQRLRSDAVAVVRSLAASGIDVRILSGDRASAVEPVAAALGVANWHGGLKPADKIAAIEQLKACGKRVLMVGDGLNDAPALAAAHVSMSPISAAHIAQTHADAVFLGERLVPVLQAVTTARRARSLMQQNLWLAVIYNAIAVPVAIAGYVTPLIAAAAMSGSSILVTLNALRIRARATPEPGP
jgi:Cu2+-exporting ATPase